MLENECNFLQARSGRWQDCEDALQRLRGEGAIISQEAAEIKVILTSSVHGVSFFSSPKFNYKCFVSGLETTNVMSSNCFAGLFRNPPAAFWSYNSWFVPVDLCPFTHCEPSKLTPRGGLFPFYDFYDPSWITQNHQVGVGLMVLQQFGGVNAIVFYASAIFVSAGK